MYTKVGKPCIDCVFSLLFLVVLFPVFFLITLLLCFSNKGQAFFLQERPGKNGKIFKIVKFKTMNDDKDEDGNLLSDYRRLTWIGKIVRKTSLDEIPQLLNVLKGEMSLVGPRPLLPEYLQLYSEEQKRRHEVKPGITGWAQVNGRNALSWKQKFAYDLEYVDDVNLGMDMKIMKITIQKIIKRHGVNANNYVTMEAFKGNEI